MTETVTAAAKFRYLGITDEIVQCERCGKPNLKSTIVLVPQDADGNDESDPVYYGSSCGARALGVTGRGASARVLGAARAAHRTLIENAYDGRRMLALYSLPETNDPTVEQVRAATIQYAEVHRHALWAPSKTPTDWRAMTLDMLTRKQAALADAARLGATVPANDREFTRFLSTW